MQEITKIHGRHHVTIITPELEYDFSINSKLSFIIGDSASGKTTLYELVNSYINSKNLDIEISSDLTPTLLTKADWDDKKYPDNKLVFIEEGGGFIQTLQFSEFVKYSNNYFVIIDRTDLKQLAFSYKNIYKISSVNNKYYLVPAYDFDYIINSNQCFTEVYTEDTNSGKEFFDFVLETGCKSTEGKDNIQSYILDFKSRKNEYPLFIMDGCGVGSCIQSIYLEVLESNSSILLIDSFEYLLLKADLFDGYKSNLKDIMSNLDEYYLPYCVDNFKPFITDKVYSKKELKQLKRENRSLDRVPPNIPLYCSLEEFYLKLLSDVSSGSNKLVFPDTDARINTTIHYSKDSINKFFLLPENIKRILSILPNDILRFLTVKQIDPNEDNTSFFS